MFCWNPIFRRGSFFFSSIREERSAIAKYRLSMSCRTSSERSLTAPKFSSCWRARRSTFALSSFISAETEDATIRYSLTRTKARMMPIFACMAVSLFNTDDSIATPSSVKAKGLYLAFVPRLDLFKVTNCDLEESRALYSSNSSTIMKSSGKRSMLRRTDCLRDLVSIPYNLAKSESSITFFPLTS